jgi:hypothetical protein
MTADSGSCVRCASPLEREDLRCPICNAAAPGTEVADLETTTAEVLRCIGCGAAVSYSVGARAPACAFCGSVMHIETPDDPLEQTQFYVPFTVDRAAADEAYRRWLGGLGWFRPSDLGSASRVESMTPLWWVAWVFNAAASVTWTGDSDAGAQRSDWAPHSGETEMVFDDVVASASRGLSVSETDLLIPTYDLTTARDAPDDQIPGTTVEQFDLPRSTARGRVTAFIRRLVSERLQEGPIPGGRFRNVHAAVVLRRLVTRRLAFPAWVLAYRYRGSLYRVVISGQDAGCLVGSAPYSVARILGVICGGALAIALIVALIVTL